MAYARVYDQQRQLLGLLENAEIAYTLKDVPLHTATVNLPLGDPANELCQMHNLVEVFDGERRIELFRIVGIPDTALRPGGKIAYKCEHVLATLIDEVLFGYHEIGGSAYGADRDTVNTRACLHYVLSHQQTRHWVLGQCDYDRLFQYSWENETVLRALLSIPNRLEDEYMFTTDTTVYPWVVNLVQLGTDTDCELRYARNMDNIAKSVDASQLVTRLYPLGYGEGVNQLTIREVNGGLAYIDADTAAVWGVKSRVWVDHRFEIAQSLLERARAILDELKNPYISYKVKAIDLYRLTGEPYDLFAPGKLVRVIDQEHGVRVDARVTEITKPDVYGKPGEITVTIANKAKDVADALSELAGRASIAELYAQGATNMYAQQYADNADPTHPATMRIYIPEECVRINKMLLTWDTAPFRGYTTGAEAGGGSATTSGASGEGSYTSTAGGGQQETSGSSSVKTVTLSNAETSVSLSGTMTGYSSPDAAWLIRSAEGETGTASITTGYSGTHYHTAPNHCHEVSVSGSTSSVGTTASSAGSHYHSAPNHRHAVDSSAYTGYASGSTDTDGSHSHSVGSHSHSASVSGYTGYTQGTTSSDGSHAHSGGAHTHTIAHTHSMQEHTHSFGNHTHAFGHSHSIEHTHQITFPAHQHSVNLPSHSHTVDLPAHTHMIQYGIYEGGSAYRVTVRVDDTPVPLSDDYQREIDITKWLSKDEAGKILRGTWHEVRMVPDGLTRVEANLFVQVFVRSQGGGDY